MIKKLKYRYATLSFASLVIKLVDYFIYILLYICISIYIYFYIYVFLYIYHFIYTHIIFKIMLVALEH